MIIPFLISGLVLGWLLGANDGVNIYGTAVSTKMINFKRAALIAGFFVILGAVFDGFGPAKSIHKLGGINALEGAFSVAFSAALVIFILKHYDFPVSITQAIVGSILGWNLFTHTSLDIKVLTQILVSWIAAPILSAILAAILFLGVRSILKKLHLHLFILDIYIRWSLLIVGAFAAYSLGANNIGNVMGVFLSSSPNVILNLGIIQLSGSQLLFLVGGIAIAIGFYTYQERMMKTVGDGIIPLSPEAAIAVVFAQALILFIFSSSALASFLVYIGLPQIPHVPISSSQLIVCNVIGIGLIKGSQDINFNVLGKIGISWIITPLGAGIISIVVLFFLQNVFGLSISNSPISDVIINSPNQFFPKNDVINLIIPALIIIIALVLTILGYYMIRQQKLRLITERELNNERKEYFLAQQALTDANLRTIQLENATLSNKLEFKHKELIYFALNIVEQREYLDFTYNKLKEISQTDNSDDVKHKIDLLLESIKQKMNFTVEVEDFYKMVEQINHNFTKRLVERFPDLTEKDYKLTKLLRLGFSSKEIAPLLNISIKSVEINRYRLRKKLGLDRGSNLIQFINQI